jgi:hypothetical protein
VVDVAAWGVDEEVSRLPGSKPKITLICSTEEIRPFLNPGQGYVYKLADMGNRRAVQLWCEVIAYEVGRLVGVAVPPALVATNSEAGTIGALIEFFYPYPRRDVTVRHIHGADLMQDRFTDEKRGRPHALRDNMRLARAYQVIDYLPWWSDAIVFDALIGNVDRHPENWGFLVRPDAAPLMAPLYDNGTSLGWNYPDAQITPAWPKERLAQWIGRGRHHCGWTSTDDKQMPHFELVGQFLETYPDFKDRARAMLNFDEAQIVEITDWCQGFDMVLPFSASRARFVVDQVMGRREQLLSVIVP